VNPLPPERPGPWSTLTRDRSFLAVLIGSLVAVFVVVLPFMDALVLASATVVVSYPVFERVRRRVGGRSYLAAGITTTGVVMLVLVPLMGLAIWFVQEAAGIIQHGVELAKTGTLRQSVETWFLALRIPGERTLNETLGTELDLISMIVEPLQRTLISLGQTLASSLPDLFGILLGAGLDVFVFLFAVVTLYAEGPVVLKALGRLSPLRAEYHRRLFEVFREFSTNLVFGALATALVQAMVATAGYALVGAPNLVLLGLLTAVFSFIPLIGTSIVWIPVTIWVAVNHGWGWAAVSVAWNLGLTGTVDNVLRPLFLRGRSPIHPLLIFLSVLGGLYWLGLPGALVGPVTVAVFLALYRIWGEQLAEQGVMFPDATPAPAEPYRFEQLEGGSGGAGDAGQRRRLSASSSSSSSSSSESSSSSSSSSESSSSAPSLSPSPSSPSPVGGTTGTPSSSSSTSAPSSSRV
jgi:predicted PurR-regulated permease PerM